MNLDRVTITGADDSVTPECLLNLSREFPFVEWGILVSASNMGRPRFPSPRWITDIQGVAETTGTLTLSLHVCGSWVRSLLMGRFEIPAELLHCFARVQLNFHAQREVCYPGSFRAAAGPALRGKEVIFQIDGADGNVHMEEYNVDYGNAVPLFDISGGAGIVPEKWPEPEYMQDDVTACYHGYAGGLGPANLAVQLPLIGAAAGNTRIWVDMETKVRSPDDRHFDLSKVRGALEICRPFVKGTGKTEQPAGEKTG